MREYLTNQMLEKKQNEISNKKIHDQQVDLWRKDNTEYFEREKEINDRVYIINIKLVLIKLVKTFK